MKKAYKFGLWLLAIIVLAVTSLFVYVSIDTPTRTDLAYLADDLKTIAPQTAKVDGVKLYTQPDPYTCGVTTVSVVASFLGKQDVPPQALIQKYSLPGGMTSAKMVELLSHELPGYQVTYRHDESDGALLKTIAEQLGRGVPVPIFFGAANPHNKPYYDFHASAVTGLDVKNQRVTIANVYGYEEQITLAEFLDRMAFRGTRNYPLVQRAVLKFGLMDRNAMLSLTRK